jgi:DNA-binding response OmpR family regulator
MNHQSPQTPAGRAGAGTPTLADRDERSPASHTKARIIIVDDDELVVEMVRSCLEARGHIVGALYEGGAVRSIAEFKRPDLLVLDCVMPGVSGIEVLRDIRASSTVYATPVLMLTGRQSSADEMIAVRAGADDYLRKPFDPDQLVARVESLLATKRRG